MTMTDQTVRTVRQVEVDVEVDEAIFHASDVVGHEVTMDLAGKIGKSGGRAVAARDLLLMALAGCSGGSFLNELRSRGKTLHTVSVSLTGEIDTHPPAVFRKISMHFTVTGEDLDDESMRAAALACHGDCSIHATLSHVAEITTTYEVRNTPMLAGSVS